MPSLAQELEEELERAGFLSIFQCTSSKISLISSDSLSIKKPCSKGEKNEHIYKIQDHINGKCFGTHF